MVASDLVTSIPVLALVHVLLTYIRFSLKTTSHLAMYTEGHNMDKLIKMDRHLCLNLTIGLLQCCQCKRNPA